MLNFSGSSIVNKEFKLNVEADEIQLCEGQEMKHNEKREGGLKWHTTMKQHISDFKISVQVWHWQDGSNDAKSLQGPPTKFVTSYLEPVICEPPFLHIALREIFCLCVVKVQIFLTNEANQQNFKN
ncbi:hypothetical protein PV326_008615 [Microctonus aethiopoides]|nr:hypothetical protein PV326_008615 [Microctonus aethiopoides]